MAAMTRQHGSKNPLSNNRTKVILFTSITAAAILLAALFTMSSCRTPRQGTESAVADSTTDRVTTPDLEKYLSDAIESPAKWRWEVDIRKAATNLNMSVADLNKRGGYFSFKIKVPTGEGTPPIEIPVATNMMQYKWSLTQPGVHLPTVGKDPYVHIIPQKYGDDQAEMVKYMKEGDIIVYFHPEYSPDSVDQLDQWNASHAATIIERKSAAGAAVPIQLLTVDTPSGYAQPFNGGSTTPFHVFRIVVPGGPEELSAVYRSQAARWGSLGFDLFQFGDYDAMTLKLPRDVDKFADGFLKGANIDDMYCASFVFTNINLAWMRPMTKAGLGTQRFNAYYNANDNAGHKFAFSSDLRKSHKYGSGNFKTDYAVPAALAETYAEQLKARDSFIFEPMTAPEMLMNILDRILGPDMWLEPSEQNLPKWQQHAALKAGILAGMKQTIIDKATVNPDERYPAAKRQKIADMYNSGIEKQFTAVQKLYQQAQAVRTVQEMGDKQEEIRKFLANLVTMERTGIRPPKGADNEIPGDLPIVGRKWVPPYTYIRTAENYERFYLPADKRMSYEPMLVYVGTVIHEKFLKARGAADTGDIRPIPATAATPQDTQLYRSIKQRLRLASNTTSVNASAKLFDKLVAGGATKGLNEFEKNALIVMRSSWLTPAEIRRATPQQIALHNRYGLDPVLYQRTLVSYWNDPTNFRPAIYEGRAASIASATENLRILMSQPISAMDAGTAPNPLPDAIHAHPRRSTPVPCISGTDMLPSINGDRGSCRE